MSEAIQINPKAMKIVFQVLMVLPIVYIGLLLMLESIMPPLSKTTEMIPYITEVLFAMIFVNIIFATKVILPKARSIKGPEAFGVFIIAVTLGEAISIYGLLIGLLQLFATIGFIIWYQVLAFMLVSIVFIYVIYSSDIIPWMNQLDQDNFNHQL